MGASASNENGRSAAFNNPEPSQAIPIFISNEVLLKLRQTDDPTPPKKSIAETRNQTPTQPVTSPPPQPTKVPDVGGACCCLHAPLQRRPVTAEEVQTQMTPVEQMHEVADMAWKQREAIRRLPNECLRNQAELVACYKANKNRTLHCQQIYREYGRCVQMHCDQMRHRNAMHPDTIPEQVYWTCNKYECIFYSVVYLLLEHLGIVQAQNICDVLSNRLSLLPQLFDKAARLDGLENFDR